MEFVAYVKKDTLKKYSPKSKKILMYINKLQSNPAKRGCSANILFGRLIISCFFVIPLNMIILYPYLNGT